MNGAARRKSGRSALELIEEATHLIRSAPAGTLASYYAGTIPFLLGFLYFWADMSQSAFANQHLAEAALGLVPLFVWMKFCQSHFTRRIRAQLAAEPFQSWTLRQTLGVLLAQAIIQPFGLFVIPLSAIPALPFAWVYAFYQNATVFGDADSSEISLTKRAWKQAKLWPRQNHLVLLILTLFALCLFLNWCILGLSLPGLIKTLFGVESRFSQSPWAMLNTTFFMAAAGFAYLSLDPILKTVYVLRCFYGESLESGEDLKVQLKRFAATPITVAVFAIVFQLMTSTPTSAQETSVEPTSQAKPQIQSVSPTDLDQQIDKVIHERKYTWRIPREKVAGSEGKDGVLAKFFAKVGDLLRKWIKAILEWIYDLWRKLFGPKQPTGGTGSGFGTGWIQTQQVLLFTLVAVALISLTIFVMRNWRRRRANAEVITAEAIQPAPDLSDENVGADQLPEDGWTKLGRELLERGEFRLAMRAFYLASLAHLAQRNLISLARFKSNRDYEDELRRRAHAIPNLLPVFGENLSVFERIWYGMHEVSRDSVQQFASNVDRIKTAA